jgi:hypothetical protein
LQFTAKTRNMIFLVIFEKNSEKKVHRFFRKLAQKKGNCHLKVGLRQEDILKFEWSNLSKSYFLTSFIRKSGKNEKISKIFF